MIADPSVAAERRRPAQARGRARLDRILDAAAELLANGGTEALTTNAVALTARTSVGSIYEYFADREAVAGALAVRLAERYEVAPLGPSMPSPAASRAALAAQLVGRLLAWWDADPAIASLWWLAPGRSALGTAVAPLGERVAAATAAMIAEGTGTDDRAGVERAADVTVAVVTGLLYRGARAGERRALRRVATEAVGAVLAAELPVATGSPVAPEHQQPSPSDETTGRRRRVLDGRQRMLDAAVDRLVVNGYSGATTVAIQAAAGVSRRRLLHQFPSRDLLLVAAVGHPAEQRVRATQRRVAETVRAEREGDRRIDHVVELMWASYHEPHYWAASELWMAARTNAEIAMALRPHEHRLGATIRDAVGEMFGAPYAEDTRFAMLRDVLLTSMRGVAAAYAFERRDPTDDPFLTTWKELAHLVLRPMPEHDREVRATNSQP